MDPEEEIEEQDPQVEEEDQEEDQEEDDGEEQDPEEEEEPAAEDPEPEQEPVRPPAIVDSGETENERYLRENLDPEIHRRLMAVIGERTTRAAQSLSVGQMHVAAATAEHPELWRTYGPAAASVLASNPTQGATREGVDAALMVAALGPHMGKPTFAQEVRRMADLLSDRPARRPARAQPSIAPEQRPPSPNSGTRAAAAPVSTREARIKQVMKSYDVERHEAEQMYSELVGRRG